MGEFLRVLAETISWCRLRASPDDPKNSLRSAELRPLNLSNTPDQWRYFDYHWGGEEQNQAVVAALAARRAELLRAENRYPDNVTNPDLSDGRLLIMMPEQTDSSGVSEPETLGFVDVHDVPAWDTWVCYRHETNEPDAERVRRTQKEYRAFYNRRNRSDFVDWQPPKTVSYLLCWIPAPFVSVVAEGMLVNPMDCFFWAADYRRNHCNTAFLRQLDSAGFLK